MPDTNTPLNTGAPQTPLDEEAIASQDRMEMSAPIEQIASDPINGMPYTGSAPAVPPATPVNAPLSVNVAPFASSAQPAPEVEYVPIAPEDLMPPPPEPLPQPPAPAVQTVPIPQPAQAPQAAPPAPLPIYEPPASPVPPRYEAPATRGSSLRSQSASSFDPVDEVVTTAPETLGPAASPSFAVSIERAIPTGPTDLTGQTVPGGPAMQYSHNSRIVWQSQRSSKRIYLMAWGGLLFFFGAVFIYWLIIGSPTRVEDIPLIKNLIK